MIGRLTGIVDELNSDSFILDVGGVGYSIFASTNTLYKLSLGSNVSILIETYVREDLIHLYGFFTREEKECFLKLNSVSGVGTKMALSILSSLSPMHVAKAIVNQDKSSFKMISGIGAKLADRIILELKDKKIAFAGEMEVTDNNKDLFSDAISALVSIGVSKNEAQISVQKILQNKPNIQIDNLIREALKNRNM